MNAIRHNRIGVVTNEDGSIDVVVPPGMAEEFKKMVARATNTWPDQHVEIRDFKDRLFNQSDIIGPCMKHELYGYPHYPQAQVVVKDIPTTPIETPQGVINMESPPAKQRCEGHPETCNCDYHAR